MNYVNSYERIFFRLVLYLGTISLLLFGPAAVSGTREANQAAGTSRILSRSVTRRDTVCQAKPDLSFCGSAQLNADHAEAATAFEEASYLHLRADRLAMLAWVIPLGFALAFYAGRWALAGRIRPFWPLKKV
jgi:hypothetical protein